VYLGSPDGHTRQLNGIMLKLGFFNEKYKGKNSQRCELFGFLLAVICSLAFLGSTEDPQK
jgi:hypothetical protein